jgi:hypothetical protein
MDWSFCYLDAGTASEPTDRRPYRCHPCHLSANVIYAQDGTDLAPLPLARGLKGSVSMSDNKNPNQKQPGEKKPGKFHYNPGNMSGKTLEQSREEANTDREKSRHEQQDHKH